MTRQRSRSPGARSRRRLLAGVRRGWWLGVAAVAVVVLMAAASSIGAVSARAPAGAPRISPKHAAAAAPAAASSRPPKPGLAVGAHGVLFGLAPAPLASGRARPYFLLHMASGRSVTDTVILTNPAKRAERLRISGATGVTAPNGGSAYVASFGRCNGAGCWVHGLPRAVRLPAGRAEALKFAVTVPAGTPPGEYLAGIAAEPAVLPRPVVVGSNGQATARAVIVEQVIVGVAITVGSRSGLTTRLRIANVTGQFVGSTARLEIVLRNTGQLFTAATGAASCVAGDGTRYSIRVFAGMVLPHDQAIIAANAPGIGPGAVQCTVRLRYGRILVARWSGAVIMPAVPRTRIVHTGNGVYAVLPIGGVPGWAVGLIVLGVLIFVALAMLLLRGRRRGPPGTGGPSGRAGPRRAPGPDGSSLDRLLGGPWRP